MEKIVGYRELTPDEIEIINDIKAQANNLGAVFTVLESRNSEVDKRWLAIAKTHLQQGFMAMVRAIAKPEGF